MSYLRPWHLVVNFSVTKGIHIQGYTDDKFIIIFGNFTKTVLRIINKGLNEVNGWCNKEGASNLPKPPLELSLERKV